MQAPANESDTGLAVEGANEREIEDLLAAQPETKVRVVSKKHGMFELFGVSKDVALQYVHAQIEKNVYIRAQSQILPEKKDSLFSVPGPEGMQVPGLNKCKKTLPGPTAVLTVESPFAGLNQQTIDISTKVKVNAKQSHAALGPALRTAIAILPPSGSLKGDQVLNADEAEFTPDALGAYRVLTVVQDSDDSCALDGVVFIVTANRPFVGNNAPKVNVDMSQITHLGLTSEEEASKISQGEGQLIAIVDSGVNYNHSTLAENILINDKEIDGNDIDEDGNGFKNDVLGWDFVNNDAFPYDDAGHGTHVAGLAASREFGAARKAKILPVKAMTEFGGDVISIAAAIRYAVDRGARIINLSLGGEGPAEHPSIISAVKYAESKGALLVIAAGNGDATTGVGFNIDFRPVWPASLPNKNILTVASFDKINGLSPYSNFGKAGVDVVAPGGWMPFDGMLSSAMENAVGADLVSMSGTSMASPIVSGIAAQVWSLKPDLTVQQVKDILMSAGPEVQELKNITGSGRHLNALSAVQQVAAPAVLN